MSEIERKIQKRVNIISNIFIFWDPYGVDNVLLLILLIPIGIIIKILEWLKYEIRY